MGFFGLGVFSVFQCHSFGEKGVSFIVLPGIDRVFLLCIIYGSNSGFIQAPQFRILPNFKVKKGRVLSYSCKIWS